MQPRPSSMEMYTFSGKPPHILTVLAVLIPYFLILGIIERITHPHRTV